MSTFFETAIFLLCVFLLGFLAAIPVGASQIEAARRSLNGYLASALVVVAGSVFSDFVYGAIALYGLAPILRNPEVQAIFWLVNAVLMLVLGIGIFRDSKYTDNLMLHHAAPHAPNGVSTVEHSALVAARQKLTSQRRAYVTGFSLAFTNPMMIAWWLLAARFLRDIGIVGGVDPTPRIFFLVAGCLGIASYLTLFSIVIHRRHHSFSPKGTRRVMRGFGVAMILFALYFAIRSIMMFYAPSASRSLLG